MSGPITIVGNGVAGIACARTLAAAGERARVIGPGAAHDRPPLTKRTLLTGRLPLLDAEGERGYEVCDATVADLDPARRRLVLAGGDELPFGRLVWATGLRYDTPRLPGAELLTPCATAEGALAIHAATRLPRRRIVVVGAGLLGCESAAALAAQHRVTLIDVGERPLARLRPALGDAVERALHDAGVVFAGGQRIAQVERARRGLRVVCDDIVLDCDLAIAATGGRRELPAALTGREGDGALEVDGTLRVPGLDGVWACGDIIAAPGQDGRRCVPHWAHARESGAHAARSLLGERAPFVHLPYWFSDIGRLRVQVVGDLGSAVEYEQHVGLRVGIDPAGERSAVVLLGQPERLPEARELLGLRTAA